MSIFQDLKTYIKMQNIYLFDNITDNESWDKHCLNKYLLNDNIENLLIDILKKDIKLELKNRLKKQDIDVNDEYLNEKINESFGNESFVFELTNHENKQIISEVRCNRNNKFDANKCMARIWQQNKLYKTGTGSYDNVQCNFSKSFNCNLCKKHQRMFDNNKLYCGFIDKPRPEPLYINKKRCYWLDESSDFLIKKS